jgi:hypothetical protein
VRYAFNTLSFAELPRPATIDNVEPRKKFRSSRGTYFLHCGELFHRRSVDNNVPNPKFRTQSLALSHASVGAGVGGDAVEHQRFPPV